MDRGYERMPGVAAGDAYTNYTTMDAFVQLYAFMFLAVACVSCGTVPPSPLQPGATRTGSSRELRRWLAGRIRLHGLEPPAGGCC